MQTPIVEPDDRPARTQLAGFSDGMVIYVIYHKTFENTNVFTTDKNKIDEIVKTLVSKYEDTKGEWRCRKIIEHRMFEADMDM
jgi:hypothetical protein